MIITLCYALDWPSVTTGKKINALEEDIKELQDAIARIEAYIQLPTTWRAK
jgi:hypothetical protein